MVMVPVFLGTTVLMFVLLRLTPGDPALGRLDTSKGYTPEALAAVRIDMGLDKPIPVQYVLWLGATLQGDLGFSFFSFRPVAVLLQERAWPTFILMGSALVAALVVSIPSGIISAIRQQLRFCRQTESPSVRWNAHPGTADRRNRLDLPPNSPRIDSRVNYGWTDCEIHPLKYA